MRNDEASIERVATLVESTLRSAGETDFRLYRSTLPHTFIDSGYVLIVRAVTLAGQDAGKRIRGFFTALTTAAACDSLFVQIGETADGIPTLWISGRWWIAGGCGKDR